MNILRVPATRILHERLFSSPLCTVNKLTSLLPANVTCTDNLLYFLVVYSYISTSAK